MRCRYLPMHAISRSSSAINGHLPTTLIVKLTKECSTGTQPTPREEETHGVSHYQLHNWDIIFWPRLVRPWSKHQRHAQGSLWSAEFYYSPVYTHDVTAGRLHGPLPNGNCWRYSSENPGLLHPHQFCGAGRGCQQGHNTYPWVPVLKYHGCTHLRERQRNATPH